MLCIHTLLHTVWPLERVIDGSQIGYATVMDHTFIAKLNKFPSFGEDYPQDQLFCLFFNLKAGLSMANSYTLSWCQLCFQCLRGLKMAYLHSVYGVLYVFINPIIADACNREHFICAFDCIRWSGVPIPIDCVWILVL